MAHRRNEEPKSASSALMHIYNKDDELRRYILITDYTGFFWDSNSTVYTNFGISYSMNPNGGY